MQGTLGLIPGPGRFHMLLKLHTQHSGKGSLILSVGADALWLDELINVAEDISVRRVQRKRDQAG